METGSSTIGPSSNVLHFTTKTELNINECPLRLGVLPGHGPLNCLTANAVGKCQERD